MPAALERQVGLISCETLVAEVARVAMLRRDSLR
jgi:hypothetical protein